MTKPIVVMKDVHLTLTSRAGPVSILRDVDLEAPRGPVAGHRRAVGLGQDVAVDGDGGARANDGRQGQVPGHDLSGLSEDELALMRGAEIGIVFQSFHLVPTMTALENVALPLGIRRHRGCVRDGARALAGSWA